MLYLSTALSSVTGMVPGSNPWDMYQNDLYHWFMHARPFLVQNKVIPAEIPGLSSPEDYLAIAKVACKQAAMGFSGTEVSIRETANIIDYLIWYQPYQISQGLFIVVKDCGQFGLLRTMFPPIDGKLYFENQRKDTLH